MKRSFLNGVMSIFFLYLSLPGLAFSVCYSDFYCSYNKEKATITKNGMEVTGHVFTMTYDPEPEDLLVVVGDSAFLLKIKGLFLQPFGATNVFDVTINSIDEKNKPNIIDYYVGSAIAGATLEKTPEDIYTFKAGEDQFEILFRDQIRRDPNKSVYDRGTLFSQIERVGTKSEGPEYYLRLEDGRDIHIIKNALLWSEDPKLQEMLDREVWLSGMLVNEDIIYKEVNLNEK